MVDVQRLSDFVAWWREYCKGDEKGEAQIFTDRLLKGFGHKGAREAGGTFEMRVQRKRNERTTTAFADFLLPGIVLIEMKKRGEDLRKHYAQAFEYWLYLVPDRPKYVVLCNFDELWIYDLNRQLDDPLDRVRVEDLPERWGPLAFLFPGNEAPTFGNDLVAVTESAAGSLAQLYIKLAARVERPEIARRFVLQCMLALFSEDIGLLPRYSFTQVIEDCLAGQSSYDLIQLLFLAMNRPGKSAFRRKYEIDYFDGGLFAEINPIELSGEELFALREAARHNWSKIRPAIFGTIFEKSADQKRRRELGEHFTSEAEIQHIVLPVIVRPWRERIEVAVTAAELRTLQYELSQYQVLDPACGSGNFLYIAYREIKRLEKQIIDRINTIEGHTPFDLGLVNANQFYGFDLDPFAVDLAKVSLMIGKKLAVDELGLHENPLPLDNLDANIRAADALFVEWPEFDACIGNPPYQGAKLLKQMHSAEYVNSVRAAFPKVSGNADYCVYWFRKAHELMKPGARAGLVGTNTIRQNYSRVGGLDYIVANGGNIFEAVSSIPWSGDAKVHVSIACWSKGEAPFHPARLWVKNGAEVLEVPKISSSLSPEVDVSGAKILKINTEPKCVFQGQTPGHKGFVLEPDEAEKLVKADPLSKKVIFPYLTGDDLVGNVGGKPSRFIIDFGDRDVLEAGSFKAAFKRVQKLVLPYREAKAKEEKEKNRNVLATNSKAKVNHDHESALAQWWLHFRSRVDRKEAAENLSRYIICSRVTKRPIFDFAHHDICPGDSLQTFAFEDDYTFGILQSDAHWRWFTEKASTLKSDYRYTPDSVFDTFPFPQQPTPAQVQAVAEAARALHEYRRRFMQATDREMTLRKLYSSLDAQGKNPLRDLHSTLDAAVLVAYGFDPVVDVLTQLFVLNETVATRIKEGAPTTAPGIPADFPQPETLISTGCILPTEIL